MKKMEKRVVSAIVMILIFVPLLLLGGITFSVFMTLLAIAGIYELIKVREKTKKFPKIVIIFAYFIVLFLTLLSYNQNVFTYMVDYRAFAILIFIFLLPLLFVNSKEDMYNINDALYMIGSSIFIGLSFGLIILIRNYDLNYLIYILLITTMTDVFAYLTGFYIGEHKLCPTISPNKTIEGLIGGLTMGTFVATTFYFTVVNSNMSLVLIIFITFFLSLIGQLGDLVFSSIKRTYKVKDYSSLIPGHGGILDRFDSLIFVALAFILFVGIL